MKALAMFGAMFACALAGCSMFASKSDYADYREVRLAQNNEQRLYALQRYSEQHPDGLWSNEVAIERSGRETETFETGKGTRAGLERYLRAYPDGTFAAQARSRLAAVETIERRKQAEQAEAQQLVVARRERDVELQRTWVTRFATYWASTLLKLTAWGSPIAEVARQNPQFSRAFGALPRPRCTADECLKYYASPYGVPVPGGTRVERMLSLVLRLRMREGKLDRAELLLPAQGFSRWYELEQRKVIATGDAEGRNAAVTWAMERLRKTLDPMTSDFGNANYTMQPIPAPAIAPSGELTDTTAEDPSQPSRQLADAAPAKQPDVKQLVKPREPDAPADMVFAPLGVTKEGQTFQTPSVPGGPAAPSGSGEIMVMDPLAVPKDGNTPATAAAPGAAATPAPAAPEVPTPPVVRALAGHGLRLVMFAAAGGATGADAYDGLIVERIATAPAAAAAPPPKAAKPKQPAAH